MSIKLIGASILAISSIAVPAQTADMRHDKATPTLYQCSIPPAALKSIKQGHYAVSGKVAAGATAAWDRVDLEFGATRPTQGQAVPTITAYAINTKGTGANSGRKSSGKASSVTTSCASGAASSGEGVQTLSMQGELDSILSLIRRTVADEVPKFSCSVSGTVERPQFVIGIWTGMTAASAGGNKSNTKLEPVRGDRRRTGSMVMLDDRLSIVPHRVATDAARPRVPCSSEAPGMQMKYDLAVEKVERA